MRVVVVLKSVAFIACVSIGFSVGIWCGILAIILSWVVARICEEKTPNKER